MSYKGNTSKECRLPQLVVSFFMALSSFLWVQKAVEKRRCVSERAYVALEVYEY